MKREFRIGVFAVIVLVVTFFVVNYLRGGDIFNRECEYVAYYPSADGLVASAPVYVLGYKAGTVSSVDYDSEARRFVVKCSVSRQFSIPEDSRMTIYGVDIMGGKGIRIDLGTSGETASDGAVLEGASEPDLISSLSPGLMPLMSGVSSAVDSINVMLAGINSVLDEENRNNIASAIAHLEKAAANAEKITGAVEGRSDELSSFISDLSVLSQRLNSIAVKTDSTMAGLDGFVSSLSESDIAGLVSSADSLLRAMSNPEGSLGRLLSDDSVYRKVDSLISDVDSLVTQIEKNPKKYIKISIF